MKSTLVFILLFSVSISGISQSVHFGKSFGYKLTNIKYGGVNGASMSDMHHQLSFPLDTSYTKPLRYHYESWVVNHTTVTQPNIYFSVRSTAQSLYSDTISVNPGDSVLLRTASAKGIGFSGSTVSLYQSSNLLDTDSLPINQHLGLDSGRLSHYFGDVDNYIGTNELGFDGAGFAVLYPIAPNVSILGFSFLSGPNSTSLGEVGIWIYDSAAFSTSGFTGSHLYFTSFTLNTQGSTWHEEMNGNYIPLNNGSNIKYVWVVFKMFSNGGATPVSIGNSRKSLPKENHVWYYNAKKNGPWKKTSDTTQHIVNPMFHLITYAPHWDLGPISVTSQETGTDDALKLYPNPSKQVTQVELPKGWAKAELEIRSLSGSIVLKKQISSGESLNTQSLKKGTYVVHLKHSKQRVHTKLIVL